MSGFPHNSFEPGPIHIECTNVHTARYEDFRLFFSTWLSAAIILIWCVLFVSLLKRDYFIDTLDRAELETLALAESEEFQSISFKNKKIGYVSNKYTAGADEDWLMEHEAKMHLNVAQSVHTIDLQMTATLSKQNYPKDFTFSFTSPFLPYGCRREGWSTAARCSIHSPQARTPSVTPLPSIPHPSWQHPDEHTS